MRALIMITVFLFVSVASAAPKKPPTKRSQCISQLSQCRRAEHKCEKLAGKNKKKLKACKSPCGQQVNSCLSPKKPKKVK